MKRSVYGAFLSIIPLLLAGRPLLCQSYPTAIVTIVESGPFTERGTMTISFGAFSETVPYGEFSTPASVAAAFGAKFSADQASALPRLCKKGVCAKAYGPTIAFQLSDKNATFFGISGNATDSRYSAIPTVFQNTIVLMSANPTVTSFGTTVNLSAIVQPITASGNILFQDNNSITLGSALLVNGIANLNLTALASGTHTIIAVYGGDSADNGSISSPLTVTVQSSSPTISKIIPATATAGTIVTLQGSGFGFKPSGILFNSTAVQPLIWGDTTAVFQVPSGSTSGDVQVITTTGQSNGVLLTITSSPISCPTH